VRFQSVVKLISVGLLAFAGALLLSIGALARHTQAQSIVTATVQAVSTPIAGIPLTYTVQSGDTFNNIAQRFNLTPQQLQALNTISNVNVIRVGQVLTVSVSLLTPTVEPTQRPTLPPTITASRTATPLPTTLLPTATATTIPRQTQTVTTRPTAGTTLESFEQSTPAAPLPTYAPRASLENKDIPPDVIVVSILICVIVIGIILGLRLRL
jgi:LysM repeat protein